MSQKTFRLLLAAIALVLLIFSGPAARLWGSTVGIGMQWTGIAVGVVYFVLRSRQK